MTRDDLFIAREDGLVKFLEIDSEDDDVVTADNNIGELGANCGMALASLDYPNKNAKSGDLFIVGGNSSSGGTYLVSSTGPSFRQIRLIHSECSVAGLEFSNADICI